METKALRRPYVTLSYAQSADGRIATADGHGERISGAESLEFAHRLRRDHRAILVGIGTVLKDDPLLTCRLPGDCPNPVRVVLDSRLRIGAETQLVRTAGEVRTLVCASREASGEKARRLEAAGVEVLRVNRAPEGRGLDLPEVLEKLAEEGLESLFVEGGAEVITAFLRQRLVDRLFLVSAPLLIGRGTEAVGELGVGELSAAPRGRTAGLRRAGQDVIWEIRFDTPDAPAPGDEPRDAIRGASRGARRPAAATAERAAGRRQTCRAVYFTSPRRVELREEPLRPEEGEIAVESRLIGISHGTERHIWEGSFPRGASRDGLAGLSGEMEYPLKYGYMNAGETAEGERVFAFMPHQDRFYAREEQLLRFPRETAWEDIVLFPSVETAYTIAVDAAVLPGERVLLIGQGVIGLLTAQIVSSVRGVRAAALEPAAGRAELSRSLGLLCRSPEDAGVLEELREYLGGEADKVINLSGSGAGLQTGIEAAGFGATLVEASWYGSQEVTLQLGGAFHRRRLQIRSSQVSTLPRGLWGRWERARRTEVVRRLLTELRPSRYISLRYPLEEAQRAFEELYAAPGEVIQAVLEP
jgi:riboflavin-specific deaminase-like protein